jgi:hypothetical protein
MRKMPCWAFSTIFILFLTIIGLCSNAFASGLISRMARGIESRQDQPCADAIIVSTAEAAKEKAESRKNGDGNPPPGEVEKKIPNSSELPDQVQALKQQIIELQNKGKLGFRKIVPCSAVEGFGAYSPLQPGQPAPRIVFYCEPSNVSTLVSGDRYVTDCTVDAILMDLTGKPLLGKQNVVKMSRTSRSPVMDLYFKIEINVQRLAAKTLIAKIVLHDKIKNQSVTATQRIAVEGGSKKGGGDI